MIFIVFSNNLLPKAFLLQLAVATTESDEDSQHTRNVSHKLCLSFLEKQVKIEDTFQVCINRRSGRNSILLFHFNST